MKFELKGNPNYAASIVEINNLIPLENCDNIQGTQIFGNHVIISKNIKIGDVGIFFPIETSIKDIFLKSNNLYRDKTLNIDSEKSGFFELNGRVRCMKLRGFKSEGFFIPIISILSFDKQWNDSISYNIGESFDHINDIMICEKYVVKTSSSQNSTNKKQGKKAKIKLILDNQFHFHKDTEQLGRNLNKLSPDSVINLSVKYHGTSAIFSNILIYRKLNIIEKFLLKCGININTAEYSNIYSSRKVIKNEIICDNPSGFYSKDIWGKANNIIKDKLDEGITIYAEIVGYVEGNKFIQKGYDYGCRENEFKIYVYRVTYTNSQGIVFEMSYNQMKEYCKEKGLEVVACYYSGYAKDLYPELDISQHWQDNFYIKLSEDKNFNMELDCPYCQNKVPFEGIVLRIDSLNFEAYKLKCFKFKQRETTLLDKGEEDIEEQI